MSRTDRYELDENDIIIGPTKSYAAGVPAVMVSLQRGIEQMGTARTVRMLSKLNQRNGFDCPNPTDLESMGLSVGERVDLVSELPLSDGAVEERRVQDFRLVPYPTPSGNAAAYYPETNPLVPLDYLAAQSKTPVSEAVTIRVVQRATEGIS